VSKKRKLAAAAESVRPAVTDEDIDAAAALRAARVLWEHAEGELASDDGQHLEAVLRAVCRFLIGDHLDFGLERGRFVHGLLTGALPVAELKPGGKWFALIPHKDALAAVEGAPAHRLAGLALALVASVKCFEAGRGPTAAAMLDLAELDWDQLREQARRELTGGESADAKVAKAEAAQGTLFDVEDA
jgi:hypothetical protein